MKRYLLGILLIAFIVVSGFGGFIQQGANPLVIKMGPFVDSTDGFTPETELDIDQADVQLSKNGGDFAQKNDATMNAVHDEGGWYNITLNATDTGTLGILTVSIQETGALPVWETYFVIASSTYNFYCSTGVATTAEIATANRTEMDEQSTIATNVTAIYDKLPSKLYLAGSDDANGGIDAMNTIVTEIAADVNHSNYEWYVAKTGNDSSDGHSTQNAKLTISAAVTAASNGDTIYILPGDYDETVTLSAKSHLTLSAYNFNRGARISRTGVGESAVVLGDYITLRNLIISATGSTGKGITGTAKTGIVIENCNITGSYDGLYLFNCVDVFVWNSFITGYYDGINYAGTTNLQVFNSRILANGLTGQTGNPVRGIYATGTTNAIFVNSTIEGSRSDTSAYYVAAVYFDGTCNGRLLLSSCSIKTYAGSEISGNDYGVKIMTGIETAIVNSIIKTSKLGSGTDYSIYNEGTCYSDGLCYDTTKTYGTIINYGLSTYSKLPTNYIMGSSVQSAKDDEIDAITADVNTIKIQQAMDANKLDGIDVNVATVKIYTDPNDFSTKEEIRAEMDANSLLVDVNSNVLIIKKRVGVR